MVQIKYERRIHVEKSKKYFWFVDELELFVVIDREFLFPTSVEAVFHFYGPVGQLGCFVLIFR
jgi:hypothetical protein